ncbi:MAG TPA: alpha/beta hydrolase [Abditibacteriaceae bacterium]|nr:alpha/beta hydrolase [Abditibacteriaceae bacterium]
MNTQEHARDLGFTHRFVPAPKVDEVPTLLLLHGTGGNETGLLQLGQSLAPDASLLSPRGKVLENGMPRFFRRLAEGVFDMEDLIRRTHELADFVEAATQTYGFDRRRVWAVGYSNGANIAASTLLLRPGVLSAAVLLRAMVPLEPETMPDLAGVLVFIAGGRFDAIVPASNTERLAALLQEAGADVALHWQAAGHGLENAEIADARQWLSQIRKNNGE